MPQTETYINYWLFIIPFIGALVGWIINKIAIRYLFHNILPKQQPQLADKIARFVAAEFSTVNLEQKISDPRNLEKARPMIEEHVDDFLRNKLKTEMPMVSMFIGDKTINSLKAVFMRELESLFPEVMKQFAGDMKTELNIEQIVKSRLNNFSFPKIRSLLATELKWLELLGVITGLLIGLIQLAIIFIILSQ